MAGWCIRCSLKGWQDKHHSIAKTTVEDRGIDHAKVATNPAEAWQPPRASLPGPSRNTEWDWINFRTIKSERSEQSRDWGCFLGFQEWHYLSGLCRTFYSALTLQSKMRARLGHPYVEPLQRSNSGICHCLHSKIWTAICVIQSHKELVCSANAACPEPCSNSLQIGHLLFTG